MGRLPMTADDFQDFRLRESRIRIDLPVFFHTNLAVPTNSTPPDAPVPMVPFRPPPIPASPRTPRFVPCRNQHAYNIFKGFFANR